jgi:hypothetical protein
MSILSRNFRDLACISFWDYLGDRLSVPRAPHITGLAEIVRLRQTAIA